MASMYASLFPQPTIRNMILLASPIDFNNASLTTKWLNTPFGNDVDKIVDTFQLVPKEFVDIGVKMLRPVNNFIGTYSRLWKMVEEGAVGHIPGRCSINGWMIMLTSPEEPIGNGLRIYTRKTN